MLGILQSILCVLLQIPYFALWAGISAFNAVIAALGALMGPLIAAMPSIPALSMPTIFTSILGWVNWIFPVGTVIDILAFAVLVYLAWYVLVILMRWAKATDQ